MRAAQVALIGLFVIALMWCAYVARPVIVPVVLAWVIATIVLPVVKWMEERGIARVVSAIAVTLALVGLMAFLLVLLSSPLSLWLGRASEVGVILQRNLQSMSQPLAMLDEVRKALDAVGSNGQPILKVEPQSETMVTTVLAILTPAVSQLVLCIGALVFYLVHQQRLRGAVVLLVSDREARLTTLRTLSDIDEAMTTYFGTFTIVNIGLGLATAALTWGTGLPNPLLWGVLAGVLNYVPYLGPATVIGMLGVAGLLSFPTLGAAAVAPLAFLAIVTVEGQFVTPALMGRRLELNPFAVFLAIAFSTWLWGPAGAFVAVPLLMALSVTLGHAFARREPELPE
jgi:predicted PurR-regulated permease PerM